MYGNQELLINDRAISILPTFSEFKERIIYDSLLTIINKFDIFCNSQTASDKAILSH